MFGLSVDRKRALELGLVRRLLDHLGETPSVPAESRDPPEPDVLTCIDGQWIGIEVTQVHPDTRSSGYGSKLRQSEEGYARQEAPYGLLIDPDPTEAAIAVITEKATKSTSYDVAHNGQLWLLVAYAIPGIGQVASTYVLPGRLVPALDATAPQLGRSRFAKAYVHAIMRDELFEWTKTSGWRSVGPVSLEADRHNKAWDLFDRQRDDEFMQRMFASQGNDEDALNAEIQAALTEVRSR